MKIHSLGGFQICCPSNRRQQNCVLHRPATGIGTVIFHFYALVIIQNSIIRTFLSHTLQLLCNFSNWILKKQFEIFRQLTEVKSPHSAILLQPIAKLFQWQNYTSRRVLSPYLKIKLFRVYAGISSFLKQGNPSTF